MSRGAVVLTSGGADSIPLLYHVAKIVKPPHIIAVHADYGQRMADLERFGVEKTVEFLNKHGFQIELKTIDIRWLGELSTSKLVSDEPLPETPVNALENPEAASVRILWWWDVVRNLQLVTLGLAIAESIDLRSYLTSKKRKIYDIYIGIRRETPVPMKDNTPQFVELMNRVADQATHFGGYRVLAPFIEMNKDAIIKHGNELGVRWEFTFSCYTNVKLWETHPLANIQIPLHCGWCSNCRRRAMAFASAGVPDPTLYKTPPLKSIEYSKIGKAFIQSSALNPTAVPAKSRWP
jgi:7-cyano-7-deazaguanine synthase